MYNLELFSVQHYTYIKMNVSYFKAYFKCSVHKFFFKQEYNKYCIETSHAQSS